jgi:hypothetical protein
MIHKIANISIDKIKEETYQIDIINNNPMFWVVFPWESMEITKFVEEEDKVRVTFRASSVQTLKEYVARKKDKISYDDALQLFSNMKTQLESLEKQGKCIAAFDLGDIIVLDDSVFLYINQDKVVDKIDAGNFEITLPIPRKRFCPPELAKASIPAVLPRQTSFFSLAAMITFCITNDADTDYKKALDPLWQTPLYWALMRCLHKNPKDRFLLVI